MMKTVEASRTPLRGAQVWPLSVAAYRALGEAGLIPENTELLYGFVYTKMSKSPFHSFLAMRLARLLQAILPVGYLVRTEQPVTCADSEPEPDVAVVQGEEADFWDDHPTTAELVIEVCVTSHEFDRSKLPAYAAAGVKEVWLVLAPEKQIEVHRRPGGAGYAEQSVVGLGDRVVSAALPALAVDVSALFAK